MAKPATTKPPRTIARFRDHAGISHRVVLRTTDSGWEVLDVATRLLDRLDAAYDDHASAEAIARAFAEQHRQRSTR
jgi:hypothetical protein